MVWKRANTVKEAAKINIFLLPLDILIDCNPQIPQDMEIFNDNVVMIYGISHL